MLNRRDFLNRSALFAAAPLVPGFIANTARAAEVGKDRVLVILEMTGGNDGLGMVMPYRDDDYIKLRPTLRISKDQALKVTDDIGLNPALIGFDQLIQQQKLAVVQGLGYPNPDRSHFESMDRWQSGDVVLKQGATGWLARSVPDLQKGADGGVPVMHIGSEKLPLACRGTTQGIFSINQEQPFELKLGQPGTTQEKARKKLLEDLATGSAADNPEDLLPFVQRRHLQTYTSVAKLKEILKDTTTPNGMVGQQNSLAVKMGLITKLIQKGFGTRVFYVALDGFDTHSGQAASHQSLFNQIGQAVQTMFATLQQTGDADRVLMLTYSEFGRRAAENASKGTDHGSGSCSFVLGSGVKPGLVGKHPSLTDLDDGDLKYHTDFRRLYATLLDHWLGVDSKTVLNGKFEHLDLIKKKA